jgi:hypothetical protein
MRIRRTHSALISKILSNGEGLQSHEDIEEGQEEGCQAKGNQKSGPCLSSADE